VPDPNDPVYLPCPQGTSSDGTQCCVGHDCLSTYPRDVEEYPSENPGPPAPQPSKTAIDNGIPDPVDTATDDGTDAAAPIAVALALRGIDLNQVQIVDAYTAVIAAVAKPSFVDCPRYYLCLWQHAHFRGRALFRSPSQVGYNSLLNLDQFGLNNRVSSWRNRRNFATYLVDGDVPEGESLCLTRNSYNVRMFYFNDRADALSFGTNKFC
jgi:hypothetical protein